MKKLASLFIILVMAGTPMAMGQNTSDTPAAIHQENDGGNDFSGHYVYLTGGYSHIFTDIDASYNTGEPRLGFDWQAGYEWMFDKKIGVGFQYAGYVSHFGEKMGGKKVRKESLGIHYFAPQFVGRLPLKSRRWVLDYSVGLGLTVWVDRLKGKQGGSYKLLGRNTDCGFGSNLSFGAEYRLSGKIGITGRLSVFSASLKQSYMGMSVQDEGETSGFGRVSIDFGVRYRF